MSLGLDVDLPGNVGRRLGDLKVTAGCGGSIVMMPVMREMRRLD